MTSTSCSIQSNVWLHSGSVVDAINFSGRIHEAPDIGYVYLLALSNGHAKVGATANFSRRLREHRIELRRYGLGVDHCFVTRPHFNYLDVEAKTKSRFALCKVAGEIFDLPISLLADFIEHQKLFLVAPAEHGQSKHRLHGLLMAVMNDISSALGISPDAGLTRYAQGILERHTALGRETGLCERDAVLNALAVIEAHTGLNLSAFRNVLKEAA